MHQSADIDSKRTAYEFRQARGTRPQREIADLMGVSTQYVSRLETGREEFTEKVMERVRKAFPHFEPIRISVIGNTTTVHANGTNQANSSADNATLGESTRILEQANRVLENANRTMELAISLMEKNR